MLNREKRETGFTSDSEDVAQLTDPHALLAAMQRLRQEVAQEGEELYGQWRPDVQRRSFLLSGQNLAAYLALRRRDLRPLQAALMRLRTLLAGQERVSGTRQYGCCHRDTCGYRPGGQNRPAEASSTQYILPWRALTQ